MTVRAFDDPTLPPDVVRAFGDIATVRHQVSFARSWASSSQRGTRRHHNEDAFGDRGGRSFAVADGMGGRPGGANAAATAVDTLLDALERAGSRIDWREIVALTNAAVRARAITDGIDRNGAAVAAIHLGGSRVTVMHLGDVRVYRLRNGLPEQLTNDHNVAQQLAREDIDVSGVDLQAGELAALTSYLGDADSAAGFEARSLAVVPGDRLIACTDGVHRHLDGRAWRRMDDLDDQGAATMIVAAARDAGATDDGTATVVSLDLRADIEREGRPQR